jgi:Lon protease-like protein
MSRYLPIFPLGTVLMPTQIMPLHIFEDRYRLLMETLTAPASPAEIGVVLIERGSEVGGGDVRVDLGTVAHLIDADQFADGRWMAVFAGSHRFRVDSWLPDDPYPQAEVEEIGDGPWETDGDLLQAAEQAVRETVRLAAELGDPGARPSFVLSADPAVAAWELCSLAPLGALDRQLLLAAQHHTERLNMLLKQAAEMANILAFRLRGR